ncbi:olfactory receptor 52K2-like [Hyperolius riggenbachi]|uniref:olfactory receptor 52K2-like n=1 Tax=Hyperolius riggenbachi TaxID=752182 RepID=UPI0035A2C8F6
MAAKWSHRVDFAAVAGEPQSQFKLHQRYKNPGRQNRCEIQISGIQKKHDAKDVSLKVFTGPTQSNINKVLIQVVSPPPHPTRIRLTLLLSSSLNIWFRDKKSQAMISSTMNISVIRTNFVLVGLVEIEKFRFPIGFIVFTFYFTTMFVSSTIVHATWTEESLHEPMYIFIGNLLFNVMFGASAYFPKLIIDLFSGNSIIYLFGYLFQAFCIQTYACVEIFTFTVMAYDRYLAVGHPLRYPTLMTNLTSQKLLLAIWVYVVVGITVDIGFLASQNYCGEEINNVYCETMSLIPLACGDTSIYNAYTASWTFLMMIGCLLVIIYCYISTGFICLRLSKEAAQKATHTLITHVVAFSVFITAVIFVTYRHRLNFGSVSTSVHIAIAMVGLGMSITVNPLIYGIRTKALRIRIVYTLQKITGKAYK